MHEVSWSVGTEKGRLELSYEDEEGIEKPGHGGSLKERACS
jgi:hypothetical protein